MQILRRVSLQRGVGDSIKQGDVVPVMSIEPEVINVPLAVADSYHKMAYHERLSRAQNRRITGLLYDLERSERQRQVMQDEMIEVKRHFMWIMLGVFSVGVVLGFYVPLILRLLGVPHIHTC